MHLSIIIPTYNEAGKIVKNLNSIRDYLSRQNYDWEVIVVNDGSTNNTAELVSEFIEKNKGFRLIDNKENRGKGYVVRQGMLEAKGNFRLFADADGSTSIDHLDKFLPYIGQGYDIVIGSIEVEGAKIFEHAQWYRRWLGRVSKYLIRFMTGLWDIHDTQRGFKLFTAKAAEDIFSKVKIDRFGFDFEVLALAVKKGYKIKELPVVWLNPSGSTVSIKSYFATFKELVKVRLNLWSGKYE